jgi:hypothetical protein
MSEWSLAVLLASLHEDIQQRLSTVRKSFNHPGTKGDASEAVWIDLLEKYLPKRYQAATAHIVDSLGNFSQQIDVVVFDRQYSPFIFNYEGQTIIPAESVYAVFEAKQTANAQLVAYAQEKVASVRRLHRTSLPIPYAKGVYPRSDWTWCRVPLSNSSRGRRTKKAAGIYRARTIRHLFCPPWGAVSRPVSGETSGWACRCIPKNSSLARGIGSRASSSAASVAMSGCECWC